MHEDSPPRIVGGVEIGSETLPSVHLKVKVKYIIKINGIETIMILRLSS